MLNFENYFIDSIKNNEIIASESFPNKIKMSVYYKIMEQCYYNAKKNKKKTEELYCAMFLLSLFEAQDKNSLKLMIPDDLDISKETYQDVLKTMEEDNKKYTLFVKRNAIISFVLGCMMFYMMYIVFKLNIIIAVACGVVLFLIDLYANGLSNKKRYQSKQFKSFEKDVNKNILNLNIKYFK